MSTLNPIWVADDDWAFQFQAADVECAAEPVRGLVDQLEFRRTVSLFATGVAVITAEDAEATWHGATVNSFGSISLDPPTVLVSLRPGRTHDAIKATGRYAASVLARHQQPHSAHFAGNRDGTERPALCVRDAMPTLEECLAWFECEVTDEVLIHDHTLFIGKVTACGSVSGDPLIFFESSYTGREGRA